MTRNKPFSALVLAVVSAAGLLPAWAQDRPGLEPIERLPAVYEEASPAAEAAMLPEARKISYEALAPAAPGDDAKKWAWRKGDLQVIPYGVLWAATAYETERSRNTDYTLWIESPNVHGESAAMVDAKSTRLGADVIGPQVTSGYFCGAKTGGKVEIDFQALNQTRNRGEIMMRHAYFEVYDDEYRLLAGQTWDVVSPLGLPMINYPAGSAVGNIGYRRAQFRYERFVAFSDTQLLTVQGAIATDIIQDFLTDTTINGDQGSFPDFQGRVAWTSGERKGPDAAPIVVGLSGVIGEQSYDFRALAPPARNIERRVWAMCADFTLPWSKRFGVFGEFFTGENTSGYLGGIVQGINARTLRGIRATGGWGALWWQVTDPLRVNVGYSIDDPVDQDLAGLPTARTYNEVLFTNFGYDWTKNINTVLELSTWKTGWQNLRPGNAFRVEFAARYKF